MCKKQFSQKSFKTIARSLTFCIRDWKLLTQHVIFSLAESMSVRFQPQISCRLGSISLDQPGFLLKLLPAQWCPSWWYLASWYLFVVSHLLCLGFPQLDILFVSVCTYTPELSIIFPGDSAVSMYKSVLYINQQMNA